jgi:hypothetical protein
MYARYHPLSARHEVERIKSVRSWLLMVCLLLSFSLLTACYPGGEGVVPTIGPVWNGTGGSGSVGATIIAPTNCVEVGEVITFTVTLANESAVPMTVTGDPPLDIVLEPTNPVIPSPRPVARWSESQFYPSSITPVWMPGESRSYQWPWMVDPAFALPEARENALHVRFVTGEIQFAGRGSTPAGELAMGLGIGALSFNPVGGSISCVELRQRGPDARPTPTHARS